MSEQRPDYLLKDCTKPATLETDLYAIRDQLREIERDLISLLRTIQRAQGKEPSIMTRAERRSR